MRRRKRRGEEEEEEEPEEEKLSRVCKSTMSRLCCRQQVFGERERRAREDKTRLLYNRERE